MSLAALRRDGPSRWRRCAMKCALLWALAAGIGLHSGARAAETPSLGLLERHGELSIVTGKRSRPVQDGALDFKAGTTLRAGAAPERNPRENLPPAPPEASSALLAAPGVVVTLSPGATVMRVKGGDTPALELGGAVHLLLYAAPDAEPAAVTVAGQTLRSRGAVLFYDGWTEPARLSLLSGELARDGKPEDKAPAVATLLAPGQTIVLAPGAVRVEAMDSAGQALEQWARMPGFAQPAEVRRIGVAQPSDGRLAVLRALREVELRGASIPLLLRDEVRSRAGQSVLLRLDSGDRMRLTGEARFVAEEYAPRPRSAGTLVASLFGRVRALLLARSGGDQARFKSATATIGVKGTEFEALASAANTEVAVLEGVVGVADPAGAGAVEVGAGFQTSVPAGGVPAAPTAITPERLRDLQAASIAPDSVEIRAPADGALLQTVRIDYGAVPSGAPLAVLLDDTPLDPAAPGQELAELAEGPHRLTVRGLAEGSPSASVSFTVDRTPPALASTPAPTAGDAPPILSLAAGQPVMLRFNEALQSIEATHDGKPVATQLDEAGTGAALMPGEALLAAGEPRTVTLSAVDKAGNAAKLAVRLKPPAPAQAAVVAAPAKPSAPPASPPPRPLVPATLRERYERTIAGTTGEPVDREYLLDRGPFIEANLSGAELAEEIPPPQWRKEEAIPVQERRASEDPFFHRYRDPKLELLPDYGK